MHVRVRSGERIEETARSVDQIEQIIRQIIPADQLQGIIDNLGIPYSGINTSYNATGTVSSADGDILVTLSPKHDPTNKFVQAIRVRMHSDFPDVGVWFPPADIATQILNFGLPAPIDVQITGADIKANFQFASNLLNQFRKIPGAVDFRIQEPNDVPQLHVSIDRTKASILGITAQAATNTVLGALAGSNQTAPNFWVDPQNGVSYQINAQAPQYDMDSLDALRNLPILGGNDGTGSNPCQCRRHLARHHLSSGRSLQHPACHQHLRKCRRQRFGLRRQSDTEAGQRLQERPAEGELHHGSRASQHDARFFCRLVPGFGVLDGACLPIDGGKFPVLDRTAYHHHGVAICAGRHRLDALYHPHYLERSSADGRDHVHGGGHGQQRVSRHLCQ